MNLRSSTGQAATATVPTRQQSLGILAKSLPAELSAALTHLGDLPAYDLLRPAETGTVMVRGRVGGTGDAFNLGEMTVSRCVVRLDDGTMGYGYVQGRDAKHAERAAVADALWQHTDWNAVVLEHVVVPLRAKASARRAEASRKAASTTVDFFTMARGENPKGSA